MSELTVPIEHISFSAMKTFVSNPQLFLKQYILGIWDYKQSVVMLVGSATHKALEYYYKTGDKDKAVEIGAQLISSIPEDKVNWGKSTRETAQKQFAQVMNFYFNEEPDLGKVLGTEVKVTTDKGFDGKLPLPVKAVTDLVTDKDGKLWMWDYKVVASYANTDEEDPMKIMQAMFNYITIKAKYGREPEAMTYLEIKRSKNRDGTPQIRPYQIRFAEVEQYKTYFKKLYTDVLTEMSREDKIYLPNFADRYTGQEAWQDYVNNIIEVTVPEVVTHKEVLTQIEYKPSEIETNETLTKEQKIKAKLAEFGIAVQMNETYAGHNVILYTMTPARGVRMSAFEKHANDIKLALEAKSVRVQAPIPGTGKVGIEVNRDTQDVIKLTDEMLHPETLLIPAGVDVYGRPHTINLETAPHILIGGTTGSGKSVFMNTTIYALTHQMEPDDLRLVLIDPKQTEFIEHEDLSHLETGIITEGSKATKALEWAVSEMERRYGRLKEVKLKNIQEYRKQYTDMPYIVIVIDELADLMLSGDWRENIEKSIIRIAQKARAVGIHLIVATQRPSVDVIPGLMKANFPTQVAFMVNKRVDSQVILDQPGAEELLGKGDMLFATPGVQGLTRLQAYYI